MARVTYVKHAQQRYTTVPVIDPETGKQKTVPVMRRNGQPKTTKTGRAIVLRLTQEDRTRPKPLEKCGKCGTTLGVGQPYKHISPRSGPYGGRRLVRCAKCPTWQVWEYSSSLSAQLAEVSYNFNNAIDEATSPEDVTSALEDAANAIREIASSKREGADNIESGFGHSTSMSDELNETADSLESWADEIESADVPDLPEPEEDDCEDCEGSGKINENEEDEAECETCNGSGKITPDEPTEEQIDEWRDEVRDNCSIVDDSPV